MLPGPNVVKVASGIIVSLLVLTAAPDDALPLPMFASALVEALRAELDAIAAAVVAPDDDPPDPDPPDPDPPDADPPDAGPFDADAPDTDRPEPVAPPTVPTTAFVVSVPEAFPPDVLT